MKVFSIFIFLFISTFSFSQAIGTINNNSGTLTINSNRLAQNWSTLIGFNSPSSVSVVNLSGDYFLKMTQGDDRALLLLENNGTQLFMPNLTVTCKSKACAQDSGCSPGTNSCTKCTGDCEKTVSNKSILLEGTM